MHRAVDHAQAQKEKLVRQRAISHLKAKSEQIPRELKTSCKVQNIKGVRILENGARETPKQERIYKAREFKSFNDASGVLRKQAKHHAVESGLRKHAEDTGILPKHSQLILSGPLPLPTHISTTAASLEMAALDARDQQCVKPFGSPPLFKGSTTQSPLISITPKFRAPHWLIREKIEVVTRFEATNTKAILDGT